MSSKYGRVSDPDKQHISTPADAHEYTDDINGNGYNRNGNGIYNDPVYTVELAPKTYQDTFRIACFRCQNTRKNKFMLFGGILILALTLILIIVAAASHSSKGVPPQAPTKQGLIAYGPDENGIMRFNPADQPTYTDELNRLKDIMEEYDMERQLAHMERFVACDNHMTSLPPTKACRQFPQTFGESCHEYNMYGLHSGQPCVLLVLKLKADEMPIPLDTYTDKVPQDRFSNVSVGISCEGKTDEDKANLQGKESSRVKLQGPVIDYNPPEGFPLYYFKLQNKNPEWIYPAVMVQFNDVKTHQEVTVKCTAWAQNFNDGEPQNSQVYSTEFKLDVFN